MSARKKAPLYVDSYDLAVWVIERASAWTEPGDRPLARRAVGEAYELLVAASLALTFPKTRAQHLEQADHSIVRLRMALRLAERLGYLSTGGLRFASERLQTLGRMVGAWQKHLPKDRPERDTDQGTGLPLVRAGDPRRQLQEHGPARAVGLPELERAG